MTWDSNDRGLLLRQCSGLKPDSSAAEIDQLRQRRAGSANYISTVLELTQDDIVLDLGCGPGYVAQVLAPKVKHIHCADISQGFVTWCEEELQDVANASCHLIPFGDLSGLHGNSINVVFANFVFMHFNVYDICIYLQEIRDLLPTGGTAWFNYKSTVDLLLDDPLFQRHMGLYRANRSKFQWLLNYNHPDYVESIARQLGFTTQQCGDHPDHQFKLSKM